MVLCHAIFVKPLRLQNPDKKITDLYKGRQLVIG